VKKQNGSLIASASWPACLSLDVPGCSAAILETQCRKRAALASSICKPLTVSRTYASRYPLPHHSFIPPTAAKDPCFHMVSRDLLALPRSYRAPNMRLIVPNLATGILRPAVEASKKQSRWHLKAKSLPRMPTISVCWR
jgi:hypothetical protein